MHQINVIIFYRFGLLDPRQISDLNILIQHNDRGYFLDAQNFITTFIIDHSPATKFHQELESDQVETEVETFNLNRYGPLEPPAEFQTENQKFDFHRVKIEPGRQGKSFEISNFKLDTQPRAALVNDILVHPDSSRKARLNALYSVIDQANTFYHGNSHNTLLTSLFGKLSLRVRNQFCCVQ